MIPSDRLLKNTRLLCYTHPSSLRRTRKYASFLRISRALHLDVFDQPGESSFFNNLLMWFVHQGFVWRCHPEPFDSTQDKLREWSPLPEGRGVLQYAPTEPGMTCEGLSMIIKAQELITHRTGKL